MMIENSQLKIDIGRYIKKHRLKKGLSGSQLSDKLNISQQQISRYERGICSISIDKLDHVLKTLEVDWSDFFFSVMVEHSRRIKKIHSIDRQPPYIFRQ